ncbi:MAG: transcription elongation factor GreA [bacterium]|nr:transcription elongation factor GreA [bacterium]
MYDKLTRSDIQKMEEEIEHRKVVVRHELLEHVKVARAQGDLSENFEYHAAKKEKNQNESRIRFLERMIKTAIIVEEESRADEVGMNNTVEVLFEEDQTTEKFRIVTTMRQNSLKNLISVESPMGKALMKHKVGDKVHIQVNDQYGYDVTIQSIDKSDDGTDDEIRSF